MPSHSRCRPVTSRNTFRPGRRSAGSVELANWGTRKLGTAAKVVVALVAVGSLIVSFWEAKHKERDRCFDPKFIGQLIDCHPQARSC